MIEKYDAILTFYAFDFIKKKQDELLTETPR